MKERIEQFLLTADSPDTRDLTELKAIYKEIGGKATKCDGEPCIIKMLTEVRKFYNKLITPSTEAPQRKYTLKPGNHSFAGGEPSVHNNDNTSDEDIENLLRSYPHIKNMLLN